MNWPRAGIILFSALIGAVLASVILTWLAMTSVFAVLMVVGMICGIVGMSWCLSAEAAKVEEAIGLAVAAAWNDWDKAQQREKPATPVPQHMRPIPEAARALHDDMGAEIKILRDQVTRVVSVASAMHRDRVSVHERCAILEQENDHYRAQVMTYSQAKDILALLPGPPLQPGERPWAAEPRAPTRDIEALMAPLQAAIEGRKEVLNGNA